MRLVRVGDFGLSVHENDCSGQGLYPGPSLNTQTLCGHWENRQSCIGTCFLFTEGSHSTRKTRHRWRSCTPLGLRTPDCWQRANHAKPGISFRQLNKSRISSPCGFLEKNRHLMPQLSSPRPQSEAFVQGFLPQSSLL